MSKNMITPNSSKKKVTKTPAQPGRSRPYTWFLQLRLFIANTWEIYLILLVAGFLRFYQINTTEFDDDQATLYQMAYDAVHHGLLPATSNTASIGIAHAPGVIYFFMPLTALSADPLWGTVLVGLFTTATALLTYFFTRRYYGRFAGISAALLYATAAKPLNYARFIWQPNLMPPFVMLFMFSLFWGAVEQRKGWLFPALVLFGVLYQMHPTACLLAIPLLVAVLLARQTVRWRDLLLALAVLFLIFFPYLTWEVYAKFADVHTLLALAKQHAHIDTQAMRFYLLLLSPYDQLPAAMHPLVPILAITVPLLVLGGFIIAGTLLLRDEENGQNTRSPFARLSGWWTRLRTSPYRCGLLVLLVWQIVPLLILSRHAIGLHAQYFFMLMPGPFILTGLFLSHIVKWLQVALRHIQHSQSDHCSSTGE
jgi:hypothetical protein